MSQIRGCPTPDDEPEGVILCGLCGRAECRHGPCERCGKAVPCPNSLRTMDRVWRFLGCNYGAAKPGEVSPLQSGGES